MDNKVLEELLEIRGYLDTAITALEAINQQPTKTKLKRSAGQPAKPHWTQTPEGRKRMAEIQRTIHGNANGEQPKKAARKKHKQ